MKGICTETNVTEIQRTERHRTGKYIKGPIKKH